MEPQAQPTSATSAERNPYSMLATPTLDSVTVTVLGPALPLPQVGDWLTPVRVTEKVPALSFSRTEMLPPKPGSRSPQKNAIWGASPSRSLTEPAEVESAPLPSSNPSPPESPNVRRPLLWRDKASKDSPQKGNENEQISKVTTSSSPSV